MLRWWPPPPSLVEVEGVVCLLQRTTADAFFGGAVSPSTLNPLAIPSLLLLLFFPESPP